ncbi:hypothetical protein B0T19DRAFT_406879 [Cercophora scortea]|uniref:Secreted protein n=1 Tax=Cercophora scortea TaxID=314031 RepID=A0AAE0J283_9PEZI|nr:hypothetical protein B0T19DRAFT_406879 [Cercophora scortea]
MTHLFPCWVFVSLFSFYLSHMIPNLEGSCSARLDRWERGSLPLFREESSALLLSFIRFLPMLEATNIFGPLLSMLNRTVSPFPPNLSNQRKKETLPKTKTIQTVLLT